jgi:hypothetical protein
MMTCEEAARLISEERDHPLTRGQRFGLRLHLALCVLCRGYKKNLVMLGRIAALAGDAVMSAFGRTDEDLALSNAAKQRMKEALNEENQRD